MVNEVMYREANDFDNIHSESLRSFLEHKTTSEFTDVSLSQIRRAAVREDFDYRDDRHLDPNSGLRRDERDPRIWKAFYHEFWTGLLWEFTMDRHRTMISNARTSYKFHDNIAVWTTWILTYILVPIYMVSRMWNMILPLFIVLYLYFAADIVLWSDVALFQVIMWTSYVCLLTLWFMLLAAVLKEEYVLWHLMPNSTRFKIEDDGAKLENIEKEIRRRYEEVTLFPVARKIVCDEFGGDIACVVMDYLKSFALELELDIETKL